MPVTGMQVGAVRGRDVVLAKGLEIDLAHALAKRLGVPRVRFVHEPLFSTLVSGRPADWDLALAAITITPERARRVDFSRPYLAADQAVLMRRGSRPSRPRSRPARPPALQRARDDRRRVRSSSGSSRRRSRGWSANPSLLTYDLYNDRCDAIVFDAPVLGAARAAAPERYGQFAGRIVTSERYGDRLPEGQPLARERGRGAARH